MSDPDVKIIPVSKLSEWKGLDRIGGVVHGMSCIWREQDKDDIGIDGEIELCRPRGGADGLVGTGKIVKVQSKAGKRYVIRDEPNSFATPVAKKDLQYWRSFNVPVIFVVYHPGDDALYWKDVKAYLAVHPEALEPPHRFEFDKQTDRFDESAYEALFALCEEAPERVAHDVEETLYTNLLEITRLPRQVFLTSVLPEKRAKFHERLSGPIPPYRYKSGTVLTLADPSEDKNAISNVIEGAAEAIDLGDWLSQDPEAENELRALLGSIIHRHLRRIGLEYQRKPRRYFFSDGLAEDAPIKRTWVSGRTGRRQSRIVAKYHEYGSFRFYRHLALDFNIERLGATWAVSLYPLLHYSVDGIRPWEGEVARSYAIRSRAREYNAAYLNNVLYWAYELSKGRDHFPLELYTGAVGEVSGVPHAVRAPFAIRLQPREEH